MMRKEQQLPHRSEQPEQQQPASAYDEIADWYDDSVESSSLVHELVLPPLFDLIGNVEGLRVCDVACGQGVVARHLAKSGAAVVGVDTSARLLDIARRYEAEEPLGIVYQHDDAQALATLPDTAFDGVACNMSLMDILDVAATFRAVHRILRPNGWFVFLMTHPCFQTPTSTWMDQADGTVWRAVGGYFQEVFWRSDNRSGVRGQVGAYHRMLSTYVNRLVEAGLSLERLCEPQASGHIAERMPGYGEVPAVLVARCRKS
jgi:ubiquinone/menaquinone biosynthesis C-methylase UbiE